MFNRTISSVVLFSAILLAGCAGQNFYVAAQDPRNPASFIQIAGRVPTPPALCVKDDGDIFKVSCESGQLNMRKVDGNRQYSCVQRDGKTTLPSKVWVPHLTREVCPMGIVDQQKTGGNNQSCAASPWIPGSSGQPGYYQGGSPTWPAGCQL